MKYISFGVRRTIYDGLAVCGKNSNTYNWDVIVDGFYYIPDANEAAKILACNASKKYNCYIPCYGLGGYCIGEYNKGEKYKR